MRPEGIKVEVPRKLAEPVDSDGPLASWRVRRGGRFAISLE
jgi:hypothetical protein